MRRMARSYDGRWNILDRNREGREELHLGGGFEVKFSLRPSPTINSGQVNPVVQRIVPLPSYPPDGSELRTVTPGRVDFEMLFEIDRWSDGRHFVFGRHAWIANTETASLGGLAHYASAICSFFFFLPASRH